MQYILLKVKYIIIMIIIVLIKQNNVAFYTFKIVKAPTQPPLNLN